MFNRMMAVFGEFQRDDLVETMQQGKRSESVPSATARPTRCSASRLDGSLEVSWSGGGCKLLGSRR